MKIPHPAVTTPVYELVRTVELNIRFPNDSWTIRIELLRSTETEGRFRCHLWELESFRLTPSFPRDENNLPAHLTDDIIMLERTSFLSTGRGRKPRFTYEDFAAPNPDAALEIVIDQLKKVLEHITGERSS